MQRDDSREATALSAGLDEVGMGTLAGPLTIVVAAFPVGMTPIPGVGDSKKVSKKRRQVLAPIIFDHAAYVGIGWAHPRVIDSLGLAEAWQRAAFDALRNMPPAELLVVDGTRSVQNYRDPQDVVIKADQSVWQVGAASILAKVIRDLHMVDMASCYRGYDWESNAGYGAPKHIAGLHRLGPSSYHRHSFLKKIC